MARLSWHVGYILGLVALALLLFWFAAKLGMIVFISILLSLLLQPVKKRLERKLPSGLAALVALIGFLCVVGLLVGWIVNNLLPGLKQIAVNAPELLNRQALAQRLVLMNLPPEFTEYANHLLDNARDFIIIAVKTFMLPALHALSGIIELVCIPIITFFLLKDSCRLRGMAVSFVAPQERNKILGFFDDTATVLGGYIKGQVTVCMVAGSSVFVFFLLVHMPYAAVFAAITAMAELIPVLGPIMAFLVGVMFALSFSTALAIKVAIFYLIMFKISNTLIYPNLIGKAVCLHPVIIMVGLLLFGSLFGALGMMTAVPAMGLIRVVLEHILPKYAEPE